MRARILVGPAGSGKTHRCLAEIRAALRARPEGRPLLLIAPRQATFQLERQLLNDLDQPGYTRLYIFSFERLSQFILQRTGGLAPKLITEEGRVMVLRALLARHANDLRLFHATVRFPGLAHQLGLVLDQLQKHRLTPALLRQEAQRRRSGDPLAAKLEDFALLMDKYNRWLAEHGLRDEGSLLDAAAGALDRIVANSSESSPRLIVPTRGENSARAFAGIWLDGFAQMAPQERHLLAALLPHCDTATLAFCLDGEPRNDMPWVSIWAPINATLGRLVKHLEGVAKPHFEYSPAANRPTRFSTNPPLAHLQQCWAAAVPFEGKLNGAVRVLRCRNPEAEAISAAREILRFTRDKGGRYREAAVMARSLEPFHDVVRRVFTRYQIPFFLDQRRPVAHHPLAEFTRSALRLAAFGWESADWFGALKTGLARIDAQRIDRLENVALARGWSGSVWRAPIQIADDRDLEQFVQDVQVEVLQPFLDFERRVMASAPAASSATGTELPLYSSMPSGCELATALRRLWSVFAAEEQLAQWAEKSDESGGEGSVHSGTWAQLCDWLDNLERAFPTERLALSEWLPILEAGLSSLTAGAIPPALDQVLVGAVDRSRNPDLRLMVILGANESLFPLGPSFSPLLTEMDHEDLAGQGLEFGPSKREQLSREQYYGYVACTRASERLVVSFSERDAADRPLAPSPFVANLQRLFPTLGIEDVCGPLDWDQAEHTVELVPELFRARDRDRVLKGFPSLDSIGGGLETQREPRPDEGLAPEVAERLYGGTLKTSVSSLERFAACPFQFFIHAGLRAKERERFEVDARQRGSFQHEVLARFHEEVLAQGKTWGEVGPGEARELVGTIGEKLATSYAQGLFKADDRNQFTARSLIRSLQELVANLVSWMHESYRFSPRAVELGFGTDDQSPPPWELDLGEGHRMSFGGRIDRIDVCVDPGTNRAFAVVLDYKSSARKVDSLLLANGIQIQLPAYLASLQRPALCQPALGVSEVVPAGFFYLNLRGDYPNAQSRDEALNRGSESHSAYLHRGRFNSSVLHLLDSRWNQASTSGQFSYKPAGGRGGNYHDPVPESDFLALISGVEGQLRGMGRAIFRGQARLDPYLRGQGTACQQCELQSVCRIDPWTHRFRALSVGSLGPEEPESPASE